MAQRLYRAEARNLWHKIPHKIRPQWRMFTSANERARLAWRTQVAAEEKRLMNEVEIAERNNWRGVAVMRQRMSKVLAVFHAKLRESLTKTHRNVNPEAVAPAVEPKRSVFAAE